MHHGGETNEHRGQMKGKTEFHGGGHTNDMAKTNGKTKSQRGGQTNVMAKRTERLNSNLKGGTNERHGQMNGKTKFESYLHWDFQDNIN